MAVKKAAKKVVSAARKATGRMTADEVRTHMKNVRDAHERLLREGKYENARTLDDEELAKKLNRTNTPFISGFGFGSAAPGGSFGVGATAYNPDPVTIYGIYIHLFVGPSLVVPDNGIALLNVDTRFNRLTEPPFYGMTLAPSTSSSVNFTMRIPATIEKSIYFGNLFLIRSFIFSLGSVLDRVDFAFRVL